MGTSPLMEGEEGEAILAEDTGDRINIGLPKAQADFIRQLVAAGAKVVLVLAGGSAIALGDIKDLVEAIVLVWYPGQEGGAAIADVLFGHANPAGRLPITFVKSVEQLPPFDDYNMAGRTYRFMTQEPLYPFGYGLSYTHFEYTNLRIEPQHTNVDGRVSVSAEVTNCGARVGDEVVQLYVRHPDSQVTRPIKELKGFQRLTLQPGETKMVTFALAASQLATYDRGQWVVEPDKAQVMLGGSSADIRLRGELQIERNQPCQM
jgi:beta-glucosidase